MSIREMLARGYDAANVDSWFVRNLDSFDLKRRSVQEILKDPVWEQLVVTWKSEQVPRVCVAHCGVPVGGKTADEAHRSARSVMSLQK
jgi:hypothetical protein